jgi:hypothetical protein
LRHRRRALLFVSVTAGRHCRLSRITRAIRSGISDKESSALAVRSVRQRPPVLATAAGVILRWTFTCDLRVATLSFCKRSGRRGGVARKHCQPSIFAPFEGLRIRFSNSRSLCDHFIVRGTFCISAHEATGRCESIYSQRHKID